MNKIRKPKVPKYLIFKLHISKQLIVKDISLVIRQTIKKENKYFELNNYK